MQPYIFPYIGYYQLLESSDKFVIFDDVNFIKRGWINRNNILLNGKEFLFSIPLNKPSQNRLICDTKIKFPSVGRESFLKTISSAYSKAPYFEEVFDLIKRVINYQEDDLTKYLLNSLQEVCGYIGLNVDFIRSSDIDYDRSLGAEGKIIDICKELEASTYINPPGGRDLYDRDNFVSCNIDLKFLESDRDSIVYKQWGSNFVPNLSIIDVLMFNGATGSYEFVKKYNLIK